MRYFIVITLLAALFGLGCYTFPVPEIKVTILADAAFTPGSNDYYKTTSKLVVQIDTEVIEVPIGYLFKIPRFRPSTIEAEILHDYLYNCPGATTRKDADDIFYNAMVGEDVSRYIATKLYIYARLFQHKQFNSAVECYPNDDVTATDN